MARIGTDKEREREEIVFRAVQANPGLKQSELVAHTNLQPRTLNNYLNKLELAGRLRKEGQVWHASETFVERRLRPIELTAEQAMCLYIAARALARVQDERNETAETALIALSKALIGDFNVGADIHAAAVEMAHRPERTGYGKVFRDLMRAYVYRKKVRIRYTAASGTTFETTFEPYLFEPSSFGSAIYAIGFSEHVQDVRSYKLERIDDSRLLNDDFEKREDMPKLTDLRSAWTISFGAERERVELEFTPNVRRRVLETQWHASQQSSEGPNGALRWTVDVADARDMLPWIRGWGSDVKVIQPEWVRNSVVQHLHHMNRTYDIGTSAPTQPRHHLPWAKIDARSGNVHRLVYHMIDVGMCAAMLWRESIAAATKQRIAEWLHVDIESAGRMIAFWAALHDLGKASPAFQDHPSLQRRSQLIWRNIRDELASVGLTFPTRDNGERRARHETITMYALHPRYENGCGDEHTADSLTKLAAQILSGHHGAFHPHIDLRTPRLLSSDTGRDIAAWPQARRALVTDMRTIFHPPAVPKFEPDTLRDNAMMMQIAGIVTLADWLGSDSDVFPASSDAMPLHSYAAHAERLARLALRSADWRKAPAMPPLDFVRTFGFARRPAQEAAAAALHSTALPALAIVELPMGAGKTEIALDALSDWLRRTDGAGAYFAMPTTATSDQIHGRVRKFLHTQLGHGIEPLLVHSRALLSQNAPNESTDPIEELERQGERSEALTWFLPRKKSLLANFGVGTVDQALLSVLQTKHFFVRLLGLSDKVVIFDEIHAYDAYMSSLLERLLHWLGQLGASVILLSATLPADTRRRLLKAYCRRVDSVHDGYPLLTIAPLHGETHAVALPKPPTIELHLDWLSDDASSIIDALRTQIADGGCAAVICNTVARAQQIHRAICEANIADLAPEDNILLHARYPQAWRSAIEERVLAKFGPNTTDKTQSNPHRPKKSVVVATQVIEQSLDLDFDVMISDLAPADLLLQRAGRLQRHSVNDAGRRHPRRLWIAAPSADSELPTFERATTAVYDEHILLRSWLALRQRTAIAIPDDVAPLIEQVYGDAAFDGPSADAQRRIDEARMKSEKETYELEFEAHQRLIGQPDTDIFDYSSATLDEEDPTVHAAYQALTRFERPGTRVVFLHRVGGSLYLDEQGSTPIDLTNAPSRTDAIRIASMSLTTRDRTVERWLNATAEGEISDLLRCWERIPELRHLRIAVLDQGTCTVPDTRINLRLSRRYGLEISRDE
jgi:CRISPR-associated endonuclease/helicase Cas3